MSSPPRRRPARPVPGAHVEQLLERQELLVKGWMLALIEDGPLSQAPGVAAALSSPAACSLCAAVILALADDAELGVLNLAAVEFEGWEAKQVLAAVEALMAVLWAALTENVPRGDGELMVALADRLSAVGQVVRAAALVTAPLSRTAAPDPSLGGSRPADHEHGPPESLWLGVLERELTQAGRTAGSLALLLTVLEDAERLRAAPASGAPSDTFGRFGDAIRSALRRGDTLAFQEGARAWVVAAETGQSGAQALAERITGAVRASANWGGPPLAVRIGIAVLGPDGADSAALIDTAERRVLEAAALGVEIAAPGARPGG